jgi:hypothetical protein
LAGLPICPSATVATQNLILRVSVILTATTVVLASVFSVASAAAALPIDTGQLPGWPG